MSGPDTSFVDLDAVIRWRDGQLSLEVPEASLPPFLRHAWHASSDPRRAGDIDRWIKPSDLAFIEQAIAERHAVLPWVLLVLAVVYQRFDRLKTAARWYERLLEIQENRWVYDELEAVYQRRMQVTRAHETFRRKMAFLGRRPEQSPAYADHLAQLGRVGEAVDLLRGFIDRGVHDPALHSSYLIKQQYLPDVTAEQIRRDHEAWGRLYAPPRRACADRERDRDPRRRLRVGFLSADFRRHSVTYTFEGLLDHVDRRQWECFGYGSVAEPDDVTGRLQGKFDVYRDVARLDDDTVAAQIEEDRIDILVALGGHTTGHRLAVLGSRPAPIQVDWGALASTGLSQIDYRVTDRWLEPPETQVPMREQPVHLPGGSICYRPPAFLPPVDPLPARANGVVTFGCFNNLPKITDAMIVAWGRLLAALPQARLMLKFPGSGDPTLAALVRHRLAAVEVAPERVLIVGYCRDYRDHLACYNHVDIALDSFPYNGGITTLEALLMGVPVVSCRGDRFVSRTGLAILTALGLESLVASSLEQWVQRAVALAGQTDLLARLRKQLRARLLGSRLCDGRRHARQWEATTRCMWQQWLQGRMGARIA